MKMRDAENLEDIEVNSTKLKNEYWSNIKF